MIQEVEVFNRGGGFASIASGSDGGRKNSQISPNSFSRSSSDGGKMTADSASDGGQTEEPSGGGSNGDNISGGIKTERENLNRRNYDTDDGDNEDSDSVHAKTAGKRARVGGKMRFLTNRLRGACRMCRDLRLRGRRDPSPLLFLFVLPWTINRCNPPTWAPSSTLSIFVFLLTVSLGLVIAPCMGEGSAVLVHVLNIH